MPIGFCVERIIQYRGNAYNYMCYHLSSVDNTGNTYNAYVYLEYHQCSMDNHGTNKIP